MQVDISGHFRKISDLTNEHRTRIQDCKQYRCRCALIYFIARRQLKHKGTRQKIKLPTRRGVNRKESKRETS